MQYLYKMKQIIIVGLLGIVVMVLFGFNSSEGWRTRLDSILPLFGHRNWIVISDSAYPKHSTEGIETIATGKSQIEVLEYVLEKIEQGDTIVRIAIKEQ